MLCLLSIIGMLISIVGVITGKISLGIIFIISLSVFLYMLFSMFNKNTKLTEAGLGLMVISCLLLVYCICYLFLGIDVKGILGL